MRLEVLWRQLVGTGSEHLILDLEDGVHADSMAVGELDSIAYRIRYELHCDEKWNIRRARIEDLLSSRKITLERVGSNLWNDWEGHEIGALDGCSDIDIMITPFTNTLPIRRLKLNPGQSLEIAVAYVSLPELTVSRVRQRYTCLAAGEEAGLYRYENINSGFSADLKVDSDGLVEEYPDIFIMDAKRRLAGG